MMRFINTLLTLIQAGDHLRHMGRREQLAADRSFASTHVADGGVPHETQDDWVASALDDFLALNNPNDRHRGFNTEGYGVYVGAASDELVFLDTDKPSFVFYGPSRTGKFATNQAFQAANTTDRSAIFNDPKGEFFERTVEHRAAFQDDRVYAINPDPDLGIPSVGFNPMGYIPKRAAAGENIDSDVREVIGAVFSTPAKIKEGYTKEDHWTVSQAKDFYFCYTTAFAYLDPVRVTLGGLYDFAHLKDEDFWTLMSLWAMHPGVSPTCRQKATVLIDEFVSCNVRMDKKGKPIIGEDGHPIRDWDYKHSRAKQYLGNIRERMQAAVAAYSPGSPFRGITDQTDFDVTILARQPSTLYIVVPDRYMELGERWATLMFDALFRELGLLDCNDTKPLWIMDELTTMPPIPRYHKRINKLASNGHQFLSYLHTASEFDDIYGQHAAERLEEGAVLTIGWDVTNERLLNKISSLAGNRTVAYQSYSISDNVDADGSSVSLATTNLPNATKAQVAGITTGREWLIMKGFPAIGVMDRPNYYDVPEYAVAIRRPREMRFRAAE